MRSLSKLLMLFSMCAALACPALAKESEETPDSPQPSTAFDKVIADTADHDNGDATPAPHKKHPWRKKEESYKPAPVAASGDEFSIIAGDVLQVTVWKEDGMDRELLVLPDGTITFPLIGMLQVQGLTPSGVQSIIKERLKKFIPDASVTVMVKAPLGHTFSVIGQVAKPGAIVMGRHTGVMEALSQAGGLTPYASTSHIIILRYIDGKKTSIPFPYSAVEEGQSLDKDIDLKPGDVVVVPTAGLL